MRLRRAVLVKNVTFLALSAVVLGYLGADYADVGGAFGMPGYYVVRVDLAQTGGLFPNADVTYRGVSVGRVGAIRLTDDGVQAELHIDDSQHRIPRRLRAQVADLSVAGEEYLDLQPGTDRAPYLVGGDTIPQADTTTPAPVTTMLESVNQLTGSVPLQSLRTVVDQLGDAFTGQAQNLQALLDSSSQFTAAADRALPATTTLLVDGQAVLQTQADEGDAIRSFATSADQLAAQLDDSDTDLRRLIAAAPQAATQLDQLLQDVGPNLGVVLANLLTTADVAVDRQAGVQELLVSLPAVAAAGATAINGSGAHMSMAVTFFDPLPCTAGYGGTTHHSGTDTTAGAWNSAAGCTAPPSTGRDVRGSGNAPGGEGK
ncbi:MCE family protein [Streptacidiphilus sp. PB12-B1b]|uniref:MCE family protein n=1 Tax=Streptacidiphilus sp. PB12-B1b TaxID=2705012 RepID=UPI0015F7A637|nr:MlaD family protein [Streptacidiphilus sp. PB12-B1b]QMU77734.1 MCE family protein [Streptacidiphilus sp. PB12-B1b]